MPRASNPSHPVPADSQPLQSESVRTVSFVSLGCPKNLVDSEKMLGLLAEDGLQVVSAEAGDAADAVVVNTCGFLEASKEESLGVIREALERKARGEVKRVVVAGCLVQRHRSKVMEWAPGVDALVGVFDRDHIVEAVRGAEANPGRTVGVAERGTLTDAAQGLPYWVSGNALHAAKARGKNVIGLTVNGKDGKGVGYFESDGARMRLTPRHYAYLRVSEGCNQNCAFCTIPSIRGKMRSKPLEGILAEARELLRDGAFELNLIGQDTTSYGDDIGAGFDAGRRGDGFGAMGGLPRLLEAVDKVVEEEGVGGGEYRGWVRLMYAYPTTFSDEMIEAIAGLKNVVKYIDIPLQHASDSMLKAMRRNVSAGHQRELIEKLRERVPGMAVRTTFISGFPGETEADHEALLSFIEDMRFDMLGVFEYSKEDGTVAGRLESDPALAVPAEVKARRKDEIMRLQQGIAFEQASFLAEQYDPAKPGETGVRFDVLIDRVGAERAGARGDVESGETPGLARTGKGPAHSGVGRAYFQAPQIDSVVYVQSGRALRAGEVVRCTVVGSDGYDLIAAPSDELERAAASGGRSARSSTRAR